MVIHFLYTTQPQTWERLRQYHGDEVKPHFLRRLAAEIDRRGTLDVLHKGVTDPDCFLSPEARRLGAVSRGRARAGRRTPLPDSAQRRFRQEQYHRLAGPPAFDPP